MKRIYQNPETQVVTISVEQIIAASPVSPEGNKDLNNAPETTETSGNLSRRRDIWADEEEEEEEQY